MKTNLKKDRFQTLIFKFGEKRKLKKESSLTKEDKRALQIKLSEGESVRLLIAIACYKKKEAVRKYLESLD